MISRNQPAGKLCIYTFVPLDSREAYDITALGEEKVRKLAVLSSIKDTWHDAKQVFDAKQRVDELKKRLQKQVQNNIRFVVNDNVVYKDISEFKSPTNRAKYQRLVAMREKYKSQNDNLDELRYKYTSAGKTDKRILASSIQQLENQQQEFELKIKAFEKEIRNAENLMYNN